MNYAIIYKLNKTNRRKDKNEPFTTSDSKI